MNTAASEPLRQPNISYEPNLETYNARRKQRYEALQLCSTVPTTLPHGFPQRLESTLAWDVTSVKKEYNWVYHLTDTDVQEIDVALKYFRSTNGNGPLQLGAINVETFPLPTLRNTLRHISNEIHNGYGFKVIRGLAVQAYSTEDNIAIYAGLSAHLAPARGRQDTIFQGKPADVMILHIKDLTKTMDVQNITAPAFTSETQVFHTDSGDVVALFALGIAAEGGQSKLASSWRIYNELAATRPDLIRTLADSWPVDDFGKTDKGYHLRPLLYHHRQTQTSPERIIIQYARRVFTGYRTRPRSSNIPPITEAQAEALDALQFLAEENAISLDFQPGDIQYINNLSIVHAREAYTDSPTQQRHLIRMWLRDPALAWPTPEALKQGWTRLYEQVVPEKELINSESCN
ncbi:hypothetical protein VHEMI09147 [[Torrubiella] hemipterigena]|uniref:TauD/TfdA-like domain-containing protein n=1 Tax=[Torrubiella] hemipterigena TaxID=1531966 RepID=A0A0A1TQZ5_9HYPO|nr:hypothetical protein VHEMI09147 [[Torrubiella] hemipterigena]